MYNFFDRIKGPLTDYRKNHPHKKDDDYEDIEDQINKQTNSPLNGGIGSSQSILKQSQFVTNNFINPLSLTSALVPPPNVHVAQQQSPFAALSTSNLANVLNTGGGVGSGVYNTNNPLNGSVLNCSVIRPPPNLGIGASSANIGTTFSDHLSNNSNNLTSTRSIQRGGASGYVINGNGTQLNNIVSPPLSSTSNVVAVPSEHITDLPAKTLVVSPTTQTADIHANHALPHSEINKNNENVQSLIDQSTALQQQMQVLIQNLAQLQNAHHNLVNLQGGQNQLISSPPPSQDRSTSPLLVSPKGGDINDHQSPKSAFSPTSATNRRRNFHTTFQPFQDNEEQEHPIPHSLKQSEQQQRERSNSNKPSTDIEMNELFKSNPNIDNNRINSSNAINKFGVFYNHNLEERVKIPEERRDVEHDVPIQVSPTFSNSSGHSRRKSVSIPINELNKYRDSINEINNAHGQIVNNDGKILIVGDEDDNTDEDDNCTKKTSSIVSGVVGNDAVSGIFSAGEIKSPGTPEELKAVANTNLSITTPSHTLKIPKVRSKFNREKMQKFKKSVLQVLAPDTSVPVHIVDAEQTEGKVVPFLMELGRALLMSGVPSNRLEYELTLISSTFGIDGHFFSTPTGIFFSFGSPHSILSPYTHFLRINSTSYNMQRMIELEDLADEIIYGKTNCIDGIVSLKEILLKKPLYNIYLSVLSYVISSFAIAFFFNAGWYEVAGCSIIGLYVGLLSLLSAKFSTVGRVLEALSAAGGSVIASVWNSYVHPTPVFLVTLGGIIALAPGLSLTVAIAEISTRNLVSGISRLVGVFACLLQLTFGVVLGTKVSAEIFPLRDEIQPASFPSWTIWCVIIPAAISFASQLNVHPKQYPVVIISSCIGVAFGNYTTEYFGDVGSFFGAFAICVCGNLYSRFSNVSPICSIFSGIILLVPGSMGVKGMFAISNGDISGGTSFFTGMFFIAISLTMGLLIANLLVPPPKSM